MLPVMREMELAVARLRVVALRIEVTADIQPQVCFLALEEPVANKTPCLDFHMAAHQCVDVLFY